MGRDRPKDEPIRYQDAIPAMPERFVRRMQETIEGLEDNAMKKKQWTMSLVAALIACILLAGVAGAAIHVAVHSQLLGGLFPQGVPPEAENLLVSDALTNEREGLKLTVNEHLYDGRNIHLTWTVESERDDAVYYLTTYRLRNADGTPLEISHWSSRSSWADTGWGYLTALNATIGNVTTMKKYDGYTSNGFLVDEAPTGPWTYTLDVHAYTTDLTPVFYKDRDSIDQMTEDMAAELEARGEIAIEDRQFAHIAHYPAYRAVLGDDVWTWSERTQRIIDAHDACGLLRPLAHLSVTLNLNPVDASNGQVMRLSAPTELKFRDMTMIFDELEFDLSGIHMDYFMPMDALDNDKYSYLETEFLILNQDGEPFNPAFLEMSKSWVPNYERDGVMYMHVSQGGGIASKLPTALTFIVADEEMRNLIWNGKYEEALAYIDAHPELRDEATLTLERVARGE